MSTVMEDLTGAATKVAQYPPLTLADRCCAVASGSTQALVRVVKGNKDLLFSGHHFEKNQAQLIADGWTIYEDARKTASEKPTAAY